MFPSFGCVLMSLFGIHVRLLCENRSGGSSPCIIMYLLPVVVFGPYPICPRMILFTTCVRQQSQRNEQLFSAAGAFKAFDVDTCPYMAYATTICHL